MLCWLSLRLLAKLPTPIVRGVSRLSKLGVVKLYWSEENKSVLVALPWWRQGTAQSLTEYALLICGAGILVGMLWSMSGLAITEVMQLVLALVAPGSEFLVTGSF